MRASWAVPVIFGIIVLGLVGFTSDAFADKTVTIDQLSPGEYVIIPNSLVINNGERVTFDVTDAAVTPCIGEAKLRIDISADDVFPDDGDPIRLLYPTITDTSYTTGPFEWPPAISTYTYDLTVWCAFTGLKPVFEGTATFEKSSGGGGGCPVARAVYGSELAGVVQSLREFRDNEVMQTESGKFFMDTVHKYYYTFAPTIADWELENPAFKEAVRLFITPALFAISVSSYVDIDSENEMISYLIGMISLNIGMYFIAPAIVVSKISQRFRK